ncbi:hypothetical protein HPG69_017735, partial [Diceros bicornis minor]
MSHSPGVSSAKASLCPERDVAEKPEQLHELHGNGHITDSRSYKEHSIHIAPLQSIPGEEYNGSKNRVLTEMKPSRFFPLVGFLSEPFPEGSLLMLLLETHRQLGHWKIRIDVCLPCQCHLSFAFFSGCSAFVHKGCRESLASCAKVKMKQPKGSLQAHDTSSLPTVIMRNKSSQPKERPRSAVLLADETTAAPIFANRRSQQSVSLSKSVSIQNIAGVGNDENISNTWKFLSHSTDSLNKISKVNESTESLTDEGTDMNEGQLMGDFEIESKQLEAESWSRIVDSKFLKQQKKDVVKRQEVIYELMQTELHHVRTLKIMSDVYSRGMVTELLFEQQMVEKLFPCLDELISIHSQFFQRILERKKESLVDKSEKNFLIKRMGDVLVNQFSGDNAERLKKTYGKFCGQHNQSVNYFKDLHAKDKRFQAFVKKKMSSSVVRRLGIPECILLVTQRITKYPVLFQRILQCTKDNEVEQEDLAQSLSLVKDVIGAVDSTVANYEKKVRLNEIYTKTDSKSIMSMKSGQMFAKEDLKRKKLVRDGSVFLKSAAGRLKEVQAVLLTDILVFLQEKDQKYIFASLDQKSTVISLKKLIVREVAHEEKGLFLISMGMKNPEMVEVHASSKEERNSWIQIIQDTINTLNRDEDEGIPSENEEEKKLLDTKARELKEQLQQKDQQILLLLEEKEMIFRDMTECSTPLPEDCSPTHSSRILFRSNTEESLKGGPLMKSAINEGTLGQAVSSPVEPEGMVGPVSLPRRAETFGGFDSHQMNASKGGEKEEGDDGQDLRRTESDSGLKKGGNANLVFMHKRNSEQVVQSVVHLHELLSTLQGVVLQQDSYIEDQKLMLTERALTRSLSRPSSLIEQEKQRSLEKQRQDLANLQKQQAQHLEEKRRREREWEARERALQEREARLAQREEEVQRGQQDLERDRDELQQKKGAYQSDLERLRTAQKQLEREQEQLKREAEHQRQMEREGCQVSHQHSKLLRIPSFFPSPEESPLPPAPSIAKAGSLDSELSVSPKRNNISRTHKDKGPFHILSSTSQTSKVAEGQSQTPVSSSSSTRLFGLAKPKEKKEKKKKNKGGRLQPGGECHSRPICKYKVWCFCGVRGAAGREGCHCRPHLPHQLGNLVCRELTAHWPQLCACIPGDSCLGRKGSSMERAIFSEFLFPSWFPIFQRALHRKYLQRVKRSSADPFPLLRQLPPVLASGYRPHPSCCSCVLTLFHWTPELFSVRSSRAAPGPGPEEQMVLSVRENHILAFQDVCPHVLGAGEVERPPCHHPCGVTLSDCHQPEVAVAFWSVPETSRGSQGKLPLRGPHCWVGWPCGCSTTGAACFSCTRLSPPLPRTAGEKLLVIILYPLKMPQMLPVFSFYSLFLFPPCFDQCLLEACQQLAGAWVFEHTFLKKQICNLVLVDEVQAGLADGDIYLSVYLKEVWFKIFSLDLFYLFCVCVCVCVCVLNRLRTQPADVLLNHDVAPKDPKQQKGHLLPSTNPCSSKRSGLLETQGAGEWRPAFFSLCVEGGQATLVSGLRGEGLSAGSDWTSAESENQKVISCLGPSRPALPGVESVCRRAPLTKTRAFPACAVSPLDTELGDFLWGLGSHLGLLLLGLWLLTLRTALAAESAALSGFLSYEKGLSFR